MKYDLSKGKALVITGPQGCGKSTLARDIASKHGSFEEVDAADLDGAFSIGDALAKEPETVIVDGAPSRRGMTRLKNLIISKEAVCHRRYKEPVQVKAPTNFIICTGVSDAIKFSDDDRRFMVVELSG